MGRDDSDLLGRMVFVVGARRSGTNWLQRVLAAHPQVVAVPSETHLFSHGIAPLRAVVHHGAVSSPKTGTVFMEQQDLLDGLRDFCDRIFDGLLRALGPDARYLVERTPWHVHHLGLIAEIYPDARVLHIVRDGRDVARSLLAQDWPESGPQTMAAAAAEWRSAVEDARAAAPRLEHYREVRYEDLLADPRAGIEDLYQWLDLPADEEIVVRAMEEAGVRFNVDAAMPVVAAGKWRGSLSPEQVAAFHAVAGPTLAAVGYDDGAEPSPIGSRRSSSTGVRTVRRWTAPVTRRARSLARRVLGNEAPDLPGAADAQPDPASAESLLLRFDDLVGCIGSTERSGLGDLVTTDVEVIAVVDGDHWADRGARAVERLVHALEGDDGLRARQVRGDVHPGGGMFTSVLAYDTGSGSTLNVVVVAHVGPSGISRIAYYRYPLEAAR